MMWHGPTCCRQNGPEKARIELSMEAVWLANVQGHGLVQIVPDGGGLCKGFRLLAMYCPLPDGVGDSPMESITDPTWR